MPRPTARPVRASPRSTPRLNPPPCQSGSRPRRRAFGRSGKGGSPAPSDRPDTGDALIATAALRRRGGEICWDEEEGAAARTRGPSSTATAVVMARRRLGGCRCGWFAALDRAAGSDSSLFGCACLAGLGWFRPRQPNGTSARRFLKR